MTDKEQQLLLKDLSARLPYLVKVNYNNLTDYLLDVKLMTTHFVEKMKPYLRPLSSMTEKEKKEFDDFCVIDEFVWKGDSEIGYKNQAIIMSNAIDWLNEHHFDYRGLIPMGLALEAPKDMYNLKK